MSETPMIATPWTRLSSESAPPPNAVIELAKFPIQCGEQMPWLAIGMNLDGLDLRDVFLGATHWRLAPQRRQELTVGVPADEIARLQSRIEELKRALKPFADLADEASSCHPSFDGNHADCALEVFYGDDPSAFADIKFGDLRRARSVLEAANKGGE